MSASNQSQLGGCDDGFHSTDSNNLDHSHHFSSCYLRMVFKFLSLFFAATMAKVDAIEILENASDALNLLDVLDVIAHYDEPLYLLAGFSEPLAL